LGEVLPDQAIAKFANIVAVMLCGYFPSFTPSTILISASVNP
jgi:hypothetical protein